MARFRKKPVVIEAVQVSALIASIGSRAAEFMPSWPAWANEAFESGALRVGNHSVAIRTLEGDMAGDRSDWIIRGVKGELYPCKPDIFAATYEAVEPPLGPLCEHEVYRSRCERCGSPPMSASAGEVL